MEDDFTFGTSVWGADVSTPLPPPPTLIAAPILSREPSATESLDDFDDFGTPEETIAASGDEADDDFGDFGDFGEAEQLGEIPSFDEDAFAGVQQEPIAGPSTQTTIRPLPVNPLPPKEELQKQLDEALGHVWGKFDKTLYHDRPIRQVGGRNQMLITPESRQLYDVIFPPTQPIHKPVNWTRSRIRRQHLIALGIPVNLDEVLPPAGGRLPPLEIRTRPTSAPPGPKHSAVTAKPPVNHSRAGTPRPATPMARSKNNSLAAAQLRLGPQPELDEASIEALLNLRPEEMSMQRLSRLQSHLQAIKDHTAHTSTSLTYLLQMRDALQQDSDMYNKLIAELVGEAQKIKTGKRMGSRRGSAM